MSRRILLIDSDITFRTTLTVILQRYRIEVLHEPDSDEAIALGAVEKPELIVVGVDEPEKAGFKIFQRLKKGPLAKTPIMLVTSSVAPESFAKHKGLKTHAEEYVDKRTTSKEALATTLDALITLGSEDDLDIPVEVDDISMGDGEHIDEEAPPDEYTSGQTTAMGGPDRPKAIDASVADDVDDAFAGLMGGDDAPSLSEIKPPVREPTPLPPVIEPSEDNARAFEAMPSTRADQEATMAALRHEKPTSPAPIGVPEAIPEVAESYPIDDVISSRDMIPAQTMSDEIAAEPAHEPEPPERPTLAETPVLSQPAIPLEDGDVEVLADGDVLVDEADSGGVPEPVYHQRSAEDAEAAAVVQAQKPKPAGVDLGLDAVAEDARAEQQSGGFPSAGSEEREQSGLYDRRALRKIGELERQIAQLKTELERARATAEAAAKGGGREQTFLNLREKMMASDNELKKVRVDLRAREDELRDAADKLRKETEARAGAEQRLADLDQRYSGSGQKIAALETSIEGLKRTIADLEEEVTTKAETFAATEKARAQLEAELASERAMRAANASDAERQLRVEREQMVARHQGELGALKQELGTHHSAALELLKKELETQHAGAVAAAIEATRNDVSAEAEEAIAQLERQRESDIAALRGEHQAQIAKIVGEHETMLSRERETNQATFVAATGERDEALARERQAHQGIVSKLTVERDEAVALAGRERDAAIAKATADHAEEIARLTTERDEQLSLARRQFEERLLQTTARLENQLASAQAELAAQGEEAEQALAEQAATHAVELTNQANLHAQAMQAREKELATARQDDAIAHTAALAELKVELDKTIAQHGIKLDGAKRELDELMALHEQNKAEIADQARSAQAQIAKDHADELARLEADKQRARDEIHKNAQEHKAALDKVAEQHKVELATLKEASDRELAELRQMLVVAKRQIEDDKAKYQQERDMIEQHHIGALGEQKAQHERAMAVANGEIVKVKAVGDAEHNRAMQQLKTEHATAVKDITTERDELERGLSAARDTIKRSESELATAVQTIADRNAEVRTATAAIAERDQRIAELRKEIEAIEQENANYQEQVLRAYQKIKSDEATVARAKKAMAIALTLLDDQPKPENNT